MSKIYPVVCAVPDDFAHLPLSRRQAALSEAARKTIARSAEKSGLPAPCAFQKNNHGAPLAEQGVWWSVTHKPDYVAGVAATLPIGIDIEKITPRSAPLYPKVAPPAEAALFSQERWIVFFRCWTAKEAALKSQGTGIADLARCKIISVCSDTRLQVHCNGADLFVTHFFFDGHVASLASRENRAVSWSLYDRHGAALISRP